VIHEFGLPAFGGRGHGERENLSLGFCPGYEAAHDGFEDDRSHALFRIQETVGHRPPGLHVKHVGEALGGAPEDDELVAVAEVGNLVLAQDGFGEARKRDRDESVQLNRSFRSLGPPSRGHDLARAHIDTEGRAPGWVLDDGLLRSFLHLPQVVFSLVHEIQLTPGPAGAGAVMSEPETLFTA
jgi:hypothetical protein